MQRYKWNKQGLINEYNSILKDLKRSNITEKERTILETKLMVLKDMFKNYSNINLILTRFNFNYYDKSFNINNAKEEFELYVTPFQDDFITTTYEEFLNRDFNNFNKKNLETYLPEDLKINFSKELFLKLEGKQEDLDKMMNPKNHYLHMCKYNKGNHFFPYGDIAYILSSGKNNIDSFCNLNHELGHYFEYCFNNDFIMDINKRNFLYSEISSLLFEHIALDILKYHEIINDELFLEMQDYMMTLNTGTISDYFIFKSIINDPNPTFIDRIRLHFKNNTISDSVYYYSYIMAINFYYQYLEEPKLALKNLKHLLLDFDYKKELALLEECDVDLSGNTLVKHLDKFKKNS